MALKLYKLVVKDGNGKVIQIHAHSVHFECGLQAGWGVS